MGERAREEVREMFLGPRHLRQYVELFERLLGAPAPSSWSSAAAGRRRLPDWDS
jgi:hypothetical protein